jgi:hypothetical protein
MDGLAAGNSSLGAAGAAVWAVRLVVRAKASPSRARERAGFVFMGEEEEERGGMKRSGD